jgi:hypothetical protein
MPKRLLFLCLCVCSAAAVSLTTACGSGTSASPTTAPIVTPSADPSLTTATVSVTFQGSPAPNVPVAISTPVGNNTASPRPGTPFETVYTKPLTAASPGVAVFKKLSYKYTYCWVATYSPTVTFSQCAPPTTWQYTTVTLGN